MLRGSVYAKEPKGFGYDILPPRRFEFIPSRLPRCIAVGHFIDQLHRCGPDYDPIAILRPVCGLIHKPFLFMPVEVNHRVTITGREDAICLNGVAKLVRRIDVGCANLNVISIKVIYDKERDFVITYEHRVASAYNLSFG
jgi:hypothetical protein